MEIEKYQKLLKDDSTIKFNEWNGKHIINKNENIVIGFFFMHKGYPPYMFSPDKNKRIILEVIHLKNFNIDIPLKEISEKTLIMVNSDIYEYAITFILTIDTNNKIVSVKIQDLPLTGEIIITDEEKEGIEISYQRILK